MSNDIKIKINRQSRRNVDIQLGLNKGISTKIYKSKKIYDRNRIKRMILN
jgi:hypothetical protein